MSLRSIIIRGFADVIVRFDSFWVHTHLENRHYEFSNAFYQDFYGLPGVKRSSGPASRQWQGHGQDCCKSRFYIYTFKRGRERKTHVWTSPRRNRTPRCANEFPAIRRCIRDVLVLCVSLVQVRTQFLCRRSFYTPYPIEWVVAVTRHKYSPGWGG